jgi:tetratricopeptide (TPR) repeat protein
MDRTSCLLVLSLVWLAAACGPGYEPGAATDMAQAPASPSLPEPAATISRIGGVTPNAPSSQPTSLSSARPDAQPAVIPTSKPSALPARPTSTPQGKQPALPEQVDLKLTHEYQKWNNCGPVSLSVVASYFGIPRDQFQAAAEVKGGEFDKNVGPNEMQAYLESLGLRAIVRVNGSQEEIMSLLAAKIPVIVQQWLLKPDNELVGHYRVVQGYDRRMGSFDTSDPYTPPHKQYSFADFERFWQPWNHRYIVAFRPDQEGVVRQVLGADFDEAQNSARGAQAVTAAIAGNPNDAYAYFSLGDDRLARGDAPGAVAAYDKAYALGMLPHFSWYNFGPYEALYRTGNYQRIFDLSAPVLKDANNVEELHFWRGKAWLALDQKDKATAEFTLAVQLNAHYTEARDMLVSLQ